MSAPAGPGPAPGAAPGTGPHPGPGPALSIEGLVKSYRGVRVVDGLGFRAEPAEITALLGPNGAGKTTAVECCTGIRRPDAGSIQLLGRDARRPDPALRARVGVMLQDGGLPTGAPAGAVLQLVAALHADPVPPEQLLDRLGLTRHARTAVRRLSGGQRQRLALAVALVGRPELVFLDEPSTGLDPQARLAVWELIAGLPGQGVAVVLTTHQLAEAERLAHRVVVVDGGRVVAAGTPRELTGDREELGFRAPTGLAAGALDAVRAALPPGHELAETAPGSYRVRRSDADTGPLDPRLIATVAAACAAAGVRVEELRIARRSLEDLFLDVTGRELR